MKKVVIQVDNKCLRGTLIYPKHTKKANPAVLFVHGLTSNEKGYIPRAQAVSKTGAICLTISLRGHGESDGKFEDFSRADHLEDVLAAYDYLVSQKGADKENVGVMGASYGGYLASVLSSKRKVQYLVLRSPSLYKDEDFYVPTASLIRADINVYRQSKVSKEDNVALGAVSQFTGDLLLIESELDKVVPKPTTQSYIDSVSPKADFTHKIIRGADHPLTDDKSKQEFIEILSEWFEDKFEFV